MFYYGIGFLVKMEVFEELQVNRVEYKFNVVYKQCEMNRDLRGQVFRKCLVILLVWCSIVLMKL